MNQTAIGIDLGGTRIKGVLIAADSGEVLKTQVIDTNAADDVDWKARVRDMETELREYARGTIVGVGLAAPGLVDRDSRSIAYMPGRMSALEGFDWTGYLGKPVYVINDAQAALVAEVQFGCAKVLDNVVMLTLGTGVGGALWLNGNLIRGNLGRAGHIGHISLQANSWELDITQIPGSLEDAIGNLSVARRSYNRYRDTAELVRGFEAGEPVATLVWLESVRSLAVAIASLINTFSPELVVLGGGIAQADKALFDVLQRYLEVFEWKPGGYSTPLKKAEFRDWSGAIGAAAWMIHNEK